LNHWLLINRVLIYFQLHNIFRFDRLFLVIVQNIWQNLINNLVLTVIDLHYLFFIFNFVICLEITRVMRWILEVWLLLLRLLIVLIARLNSFQRVILSNLRAHQSWAFLLFLWKIHIKRLLFVLIIFILSQELVWYAWWIDLMNPWKLVFYYIRLLIMI
jgi:hypothetical protein